MMVIKSKSYRCKGFNEVNAFNMGVALSYEACFVSDNLSIFVELVVEDPLCPGDIVDARIRSLD